MRVGWDSQGERAAQLRARLDERERERDLESIRLESIRRYPLDLAARIDWMYAQGADELVRSLRGC